MKGRDKISGPIMALVTLSSYLQDKNDNRVHDLYPPLAQSVLVVDLYWVGGGGGLNSSCSSLLIAWYSCSLIFCCLCPSTLTLVPRGLLYDRPTVVSQSIGELGLGDMMPYSGHVRISVSQHTPRLAPKFVQVCQAGCVCKIKIQIQGGTMGETGLQQFVT